MAEYVDMDEYQQFWVVTKNKAAALAISPMTFSPASPPRFPSLQPHSLIRSTHPSLPKIAPPNQKHLPQIHPRHTNTSTLTPSFRP